MTNQTSTHQSTGHYYAIPILFCFSGVFSHFKNVSIYRVWECNNCIACVKPSFETVISLKSLQRLLRNCTFLSCQIRVLEWIYTRQMPECQETSCSKKAQYLKFKWQQRDSNLQQLSSAKWLGVHLRTTWLWVRILLPLWRKTVDKLAQPTKNRACIVFSQKMHIAATFLMWHHQYNFPWRWYVIISFGFSW